MYCLRVLLLFYMNYMYTCTLFATVFTVDNFGVLIDCCVSELHAKLCPHHNVWPEIVYCYFTRTTLFIELFTCFFDQRVEVSITSPSFIALHLPVLR